MIVNKQTRQDEESTKQSITNKRYAIQIYIVFIFVINLSSTFATQKKDGRVYYVKIVKNN